VQLRAAARHRWTLVCAYVVVDGRAPNAARPLPRAHAAYLRALGLLPARTV
jgi:hypothetical protein